MSAQCQTCGGHFGNRCFDCTPGDIIEGLPTHCDACPGLTTKFYEAAQKYLCGECVFTVRKRDSEYTHQPRDHKTLSAITQCMREGCTSPVREPDTTVLCLEHYISGGGPRHDAFADWARSLAYPDSWDWSVSRTAFEAGWDARTDSLSYYEEASE